MTDTKNLAQRMAEGRMPVADALRCAMQAGEALRRIHDAGQFHGAVTPAHITTAGELLPAPAGSIAAITPYTAPEILQGRPADARSDIFAFGAILFEMLTSRRAFEGEGRAALAASLSGPTPSSGSPAADRLIGPCLSKNPDTRTPRMQKVLMELRLLTTAARRAETAASPAARREPGVDAGVIRGEMQQLESRLAARIADVQRLAAEAAAAVPPVHYDAGIDTGIIRNEMRQLETRLAARIADVQRSAAEAAAAVPAVQYDAGIDTGIIRNEMRQLETRLAARIADVHRSAAEAASASSAHHDSGIDAGIIRNEMHQIESRLAARVASHEQQLSRFVAESAEAQSRSAARPESGVDGAQLDRIEKTVEDMRQHAAQFERSVAADLVDIEQGLKVQGASIESARTAMSQTDDLVERVVEALESLQTAVLDSGEPAGDRANFAVN